MWRVSDLPRHLLPGTLMGGLSAAACLPGTPLFANMMGKMFLGTEPTAARIPGYVGVAVMLAIDVVYIMHAVKKADKNGMHWDGEEAGIEMSPPTEKDKVHPVLALMGAQYAFAQVVIAAPGFDLLTGWFQKIPGPGYIGYSICAAISGFFAGNAVAGMQMSAAIYTPLMDQLNMTAPAMHRIAAFAVSILDTIPINGAVIATTTTCKLKMKQSYPTIAMTTVINVAIAMFVVVFMCIAFPWMCQN